MFHQKAIRGAGKIGRGQRWLAGIRLRQLLQRFDLALNVEAHAFVQTREIGADFIA